MAAACCAMPAAATSSLTMSLRRPPATTPAGTILSRRRRAASPSCPPYPCPVPRHAAAGGLTARRGSCVASAAGGLASGSGSGAGTGTGATSKPVGKVRASEVVWSSAGAFLAMSLLAAADTQLAARGLPKLTIGSFAALATLLLAAPKSPLADPYNVLVGHVGSALAAVAWCALLPPHAFWAARALAVATAVAWMLLTNSVNPPAGAVALIFVDGPQWRTLGPVYALFPVVTGACVLIAVAALVKQLKHRFQF
eukprot:jgi/Chlat1/2940/Chrsp2S04677